MTQQEWDSASEEERKGECQKCIDEPWHYYNTYWKRSGDPEWTKEDWDSMQGFMVTGARRFRNRVDPIREMQKPVAEYQGRPDEKRYDGSAMRLNWECDPDEPYPIPLSLIKTDLERYLKLVEQRRKIMENMWDIAKPIIPSLKRRIQFTSPFSDDKDYQLYKQMWEASLTPGAAIRTVYETEEEAKDAFNRVGKLKHYFIPSIYKDKD